MVLLSNSQILSTDEVNVLAFESNRFSSSPCFRALSSLVPMTDFAFSYDNGNISLHSILFLSSLFTVSFPSFFEMSFESFFFLSFKVLQILCLYVPYSFLNVSMYVDRYSQASHCKLQGKVTYFSHYDFGNLS